MTLARIVNSTGRTVLVDEELAKKMRRNRDIDTYEIVGEESAEKTKKTGEKKKIDTVRTKDVPGDEGNEESETGTEPSLPVKAMSDMSLQEMQEEFAKKFRRPVPNAKKNDSVWIKSKIEEPTA